MIDAGQQSRSTISLMLRLDGTFVVLQGSILKDA